MRSYAVVAISLVALSQVALALETEQASEPMGMDMMDMDMPMYFRKGVELTWLFHGVDSSNSG